MTRHLNPEELAQVALAQLEQEGPAAEELFAHLHECPRCRAEVRDMERALGCLSRLAREHTPPARGGFVWPVEEPARRARWWAAWPLAWRWAAPGLAGALALVAALWLGWGADPAAPGGDASQMLAQAAALSEQSSDQAAAEVALWDDASGAGGAAAFSAFVSASSAPTPVGAREEFWEFVAPAAKAGGEESPWLM